MTRTPKPAKQTPAPHTDEAESNDRGQPSPDRRRSPEPFEECGPSGGYGGAGTDEAEEKD